MRIKVSFIFLLKLLLLVFSSQVSVAYGESEEGKESDTNRVTLKTNLQDKYYRQALYHYFQGDPEQALSQVEQSKAKLNTLDSRTALFEAGLQLSAGLLHQAKVTLINFEALLNDEKGKIEEQGEKDNERSAKANELRLIALLSLTNQYLSKGNVSEAKDTLAKIKTVPSTYYQEYHVLNQLVYWPDNNSELLAKPEEIIDENSPYILLNEALRLIELSEYDLAITALKEIKITEWNEGEHNFWKTLFMDEAIVTSQSDRKKLAVLQEQAIQDYAQLLLAQIYISQKSYNLAFTELKAFPEKSPYAESALFLFAFASQQVEQHDISFSLLNLLYKKYPYSQLGWQSAELMAEQVGNERSLAQGVSAYQTVESFFLQRQKDLGKFSVSFDKSTNLLNFSKSSLLNKSNQENQLSQTKAKQKTDYFPQSVWLQQALYDAELASLYQELNSIDEQTSALYLLGDKMVWLAEIITLNQQRKKKIVAAQAIRDKEGVFSQLKSKRDHLAVILSEHLANEKSSAFANEEEKQWLERIERSKNALELIGDKKNTVEYKERLARVNGVLSWQLALQYPERSWHRSKQLQQLDSAIAGVILQQKNIEKISNTQGSIELSIKKHSESKKQLNLLLSQLSQLREKVSIVIREKVNIYIDEQNVILADHLLSTRQSMANVLERMASADKRLSLKLTPSSDAQKLGQNSNLQSSNHQSSNLENKDKLIYSKTVPAMAGTH